MERSCEGCGRLFPTNPRVKRQRYCSSPACQQARRRQWQKEKLESDEEYRCNKADAQRRWCEDNPGYWRSYRKNHPEYVRRNRELQWKRNRRNRKSSESESDTAKRMIAKMDELNPSYKLVSGVFRLISVDPVEIAKMDELNIRVAILSGGSEESGLDCKDSTR